MQGKWLTQTGSVAIHDKSGQFCYAGAAFFIEDTSLMSFGAALVKTLCRLPVRLLVNHSSLPEDPLTQLGLDPSRPIVYALSTESLSDLLTRSCVLPSWGYPARLPP